MFKSNLELDREDFYFFRSGVVYGGCIGRNNDLIVNMVVFFFNIMWVLYFFSNGIDCSYGGLNLYDDLDMGGVGSCDEWGLKIMEMRSYCED